MVNKMTKMSTSLQEEMYAQKEKKKKKPPIDNLRVWIK